MRALPLLLPLALLTTFVAGCEPDETGTNKPVHCEVLVDGPAKAESADKIQGRVRFSCDKPGADSLELKIRLEKKDGDQWHSVANSSLTVKGLDTHGSGFDRQSRAVEMPCAEGVFRTVVDWKRVSRGNTTGDNLVSGTAKNPCVKL